MAPCRDELRASSRRSGSATTSGPRPWRRWTSTWPRAGWASRSTASGPRRRPTRCTAADLAALFTDLPAPHPTLPGHAIPPAVPSADGARSRRPSRTRSGRRTSRARRWRSGARGWSPISPLVAAAAVPDHPPVVVVPADPAGRRAGVRRARPARVSRPAPLAARLPRRAGRARRAGRPVLGRGQRGRDRRAVAGAPRVPLARTGDRIALPARAAARRPAPAAPGPDHRRTSTPRPPGWSRSGAAARARERWWQVLALARRAAVLPGRGDPRPVPAGAGALAGRAPQPGRPARPGRAGRPLRRRVRVLARRRPAGPSAPAGGPSSAGCCPRPAPRCNCCCTGSTSGRGAGARPPGHRHRRHRRRGAPGGRAGGHGRPPSTAAPGCTLADPVGLPFCVTPQSPG